MKRVFGPITLKQHKWQVYNRNWLRKRRQTQQGVLAIYKTNAKIKNREFNLPTEAFYRLIEMPCFYCEQERPSDKYHGVDRIDSSKGYEVDNVVPCCSMCNRMKNKFDVFEFVKKCAVIAQRFTQ